MIALTSDNIDKAIVNKAYNMVKRNELGYIYTNETICTFNSMLIFKDLFNNKCKMLDSALERLYYIADRLFSCGAGSGGDSTKYYTVTVATIPANAVVSINGIQSKSRTLVSGTRVEIIASLEGYYSKSIVIPSLNNNESVSIEFAESDKIPTKCTVTVNTTPRDATCTINGVVSKSVLVDIGSTITVNVTKSGYISFTQTYYVNSDKTIDITLEEIPATTGIVTIVAKNINTLETINGAVVEIDGVYGANQELSIGSHNLTITATGYETYNATIQVYAGSQTKEFYLTRIPAKNVRIRVYVGVSEELGLPYRADNGQAEVIAVSSSGIEYSASYEGSGYYLLSLLPGSYTVKLKENYHYFPVEDELIEYTDTEEIETLSLNTYRKCYRTIVPTPSDATVLINGEQLENNTVCVVGGTWISVDAFKTGYRSEHRSIRVIGSQSVAISLTPVSTMTLTINVKDSITDEGITGATITAVDNDGDVQSVEEVGNGVYQLIANAGDYTISVEKTGYITQIFQDTYADGDVLDVSLVSGTSPSGSNITLTIYVEDYGSEEHIPNANVIIKNTETNVEQEAVEENDKYTVVVPSGFYSIRVTKIGYNDGSVPTAEYISDSDINVTMTQKLEPTNIRLTVDLKDDYSNSPIEGALIYAVSGQNRNLFSEEGNGIYYVYVQAGSYSIEMTKTEYISKTIESTIYNNNTNIDETLTRARRQIEIVAVYGPNTDKYNQKVESHNGYIIVDRNEAVDDDYMYVNGQPIINNSLNEIRISNSVFPAFECKHSRYFPFAYFNDNANRETDGLTPNYSYYSPVDNRPGANGETVPSNGKLLLPMYKMVKCKINFYHDGRYLPYRKAVYCPTIADYPEYASNNNYYFEGYIYLAVGFYYIFEFYNTTTVGRIDEADTVQAGFSIQPTDDINVYTINIEI